MCTGVRQLHIQRTGIKPYHIEKMCMRVRPLQNLENESWMLFIGVRQLSMDR